VADFLQQVVSGLASGGIYALLALALVLIYRSTGVINFAQGEMAMFSTFVCWELIDRDVTYWLAFPLALVISFLGGVLIERVVIRPVEHAPVLTVVTVTLGLLLLLNNGAAWIWKGEQRTIENPFPKDTYDVGGVIIAAQDLGILGVSLVLVALLWLLFQRTTIGLALRAAALNPDSSRLHGVRVSWMLALGWGLAAVLGAVAGILVAPTLGSFDQNLMLPILIFAFAAAVLGGLDSPLGAVVGGLALGVILNLVGAYIDFFSDLRTPAALLLILIVLLLKPTGIFGRAVTRRV
jgi:branched-chain amino acid transport system permease protein